MSDQIPKKLSFRGQRYASLLVGHDPDNAETRIGKIDDDGGADTLRVGCWVWDSNSLEWVRMTQPTLNVDTVNANLDQVEGWLEDQLAHYRISDLDTSGDPQYFGYLNKSGGWYIMELNSGNGTARYVKGDSSYSTNWTGRAGLSYNTFDAVF